LKILNEAQDNSNWEADSRSVNLSSPYQVINGENTNDAESISSPLVTFGTAVRPKPNYVNSCTVLVLPWGVSIPCDSGGGIGAFSMAGI